MEEKSFLMEDKTAGKLFQMKAKTAAKLYLTVAKTAVKLFQTVALMEDKTVVQTEAKMAKK